MFSPDLQGEKLAGETEDFLVKTLMSVLGRRVRRA